MAEKKNKSGAFISWNVLLSYYESGGARNKLSGS